MAAATWPPGDRHLWASPRSPITRQTRMKRVRRMRARLFLSRRAPARRAREACVRLAELSGAARVPVRVDLEGALDAGITLGHLVERGLAPARTRAPRVERAVDREPVEPREELAPALEPIERRVRPQEHVLDDVVDVAIRAGEVQCEGEDALPVPSHQRVERVRLPSLRARDQVRRGRGLALGRARHRFLWTHDRRQGLEKCEAFAIPHGSQEKHGIPRVPTERRAKGHA